MSEAEVSAATMPVAPTVAQDSAPPAVPWFKLFWRALAVVTMAFLAATLWQALYWPTAAQKWLGTAHKIPSAQLVAALGTITPLRAGQIRVEPTAQGVAELQFPPLAVPLETLPLIFWSVQRGNDATTAAVRWQVGGQTYEQPLLFKANRLAQEISFLRDPRWAGVPADLRLVVRGGVVTAGALTLRPDSVLARLELMWHGWFGFHPWKMSDVNFIEAVDASEHYYFNLTLHIALFAALLLHGLTRWWNKQRVDFATVVMILAAAWTLGAVRWQIDLAQKTWDTVQRFGGKSLHEKHLAADDHEYYWTIETLRPRVMKAPKDFVSPFYVFHNAGERYDHGKLRYYATPSPLVQIDKPVPPGAHFGVVHMPHSYDAATQTITFSPTLRFRAERLEQRGAAAVFRAL